MVQNNVLGKWRIYRHFEPTYAGGEHPFHGNSHVLVAGDFSNELNSVPTFAAPQGQTLGRPSRVVAPCPLRTFAKSGFAAVQLPQIGYPSFNMFLRAKVSTADRPDPITTPQAMELLR